MRIFPVIFVFLFFFEGETKNNIQNKEFEIQFKIFETNLKNYQKDNKNIFHFNIPKSSEEIGIIILKIEKKNVMKIFSEIKNIGFRIVIFQKNEKKTGINLVISFGFYQKKPVFFEIDRKINEFFEWEKEAIFPPAIVNNKVFYYSIQIKKLTQKSNELE